MVLVVLAGGDSPPDVAELVPQPNEITVAKSMHFMALRVLQAEDSRLVPLRSEPAAGRPCGNYWIGLIRIGPGKDPSPT